jgi:hypothetical protein
MLISKLGIDEVGYFNKIPQAVKESKHWLKSHN